jgi:hypothetical protein
VNRVRTACVVAAVLVLGACGGDDAASDVTVAPETTTTVATTTSEAPTTTEDPTAAVEQAFYDQWDAYLEIVADPDVENPLIDQTYVGEARLGVVDGVSKLIADGTAIRRPDDPDLFEPRIVETRRIDATTYVVFECTIQGLVLFDAATGAVLDDAVADYERRNTIIQSNGEWKVADTVRLSEEEPGCDELS